MNTTPTGENQNINRQETPRLNEEQRQPIGDLDGTPVTEALHNPAPEHEQPSFFSDATQFAHTLWNSVPPSVRDAERRQLTEDRDRFSQENYDIYNDLHLDNQLSSVWRAYNAVIELPAYGYHLTALQAHQNLRTAIENARTALLAALRVDTHDSPPATPETYHIGSVNAHTTADDALVGRIQPIPEARPLGAEEGPQGLLPIAEQVPHDSTTIEAQYPAEIILEGIPRAEASYVEPPTSVPPFPSGTSEETS